MLGLFIPQNLLHKKGLIAGRPQSERNPPLSLKNLMVNQTKTLLLTVGEKWGMELGSTGSVANMTTTRHRRHNIVVTLFIHYSPQ
ncbi:hypothetical protein KIN20_034050 [Parelaphostrongylus tenuis]|uniref:Uncharacterized protein n=1 Tax=Parelaphostrongylus tenuis TaxID=148309 RepID=A0AAD5R9S7_PARTN|nr:hypothetical protein KIN20_034050 [Parelaphostrongylus tenuis]